MVSPGPGGIDDNTGQNFTSGSEIEPPAGSIALGSGKAMSGPKLHATAAGFRKVMLVQGCDINVGAIGLVESIVPSGSYAGKPGFKCRPIQTLHRNTSSTKLPVKSVKLVTLPLPRDIEATTRCQKPAFFEI